eukprot:gene8549-10512_t
MFIDVSKNVVEDGLEEIENLLKLISPYILRRTKNLLMKDGGPLKGIDKNDLVLWVPLNPCQQMIYQQYLSLPSVQQSINPTNATISFEIGFQKIVSHLDLIVDKNSKDIMETLKKFKFYTSKDGIPSRKEENVLSGSNKLKVLFELLDEILEANHKVVVFSQFTKILGIIEKVVRYSKRKGGYLRIDGSTKDRDQIISTFNTKSTHFCLLITTQTGSVGLNLIGANRVIIYDPSWGINDEQAVDRVYRIGQKRNVIVYRLVTPGTIEEWKYRRQVYKGSLSKSILSMSDENGKPTNKVSIVSDYFKAADLIDNKVFKINPQQCKTQSIITSKLLKNGINRKSNQYLNQHIEFIQSIQNVLSIHDHDLLDIKIVDDEKEIEQLEKEEDEEDDEEKEEEDEDEDEEEEEEEEEVNNFGPFDTPDFTNTPLLEPLHTEREIMYNIQLKGIKFPVAPFFNPSLVCEVDAPNAALFKCVVSFSLTPGFNIYSVLLYPNRTPGLNFNTPFNITYYLYNVPQIPYHIENIPAIYQNITLPNEIESVEIYPSESIVMEPNLDNFLGVVSLIRVNSSSSTKFSIIDESQPTLATITPNYISIAKKDGITTLLVRMSLEGQNKIPTIYSVAQYIEPQLNRTLNISMEIQIAQFISDDVNLSKGLFDSTFKQEMQSPQFSSELQRYTTNFPHGIINCTTPKVFGCFYRISNYFSKYRSNQIKYTGGASSTYNIIDIIPIPPISDNEIPKLLSIELIKITSNINIIRFNASDNLSGIVAFQIGQYVGFGSIHNADDVIVQGNRLNGTFEISISDLDLSYDNTIYLNIFDEAGNKFSIQSGTYLDINMNLIFPYFIKPIFISSDINYISFYSNEMDTTMSSVENSMFINFTSSVDDFLFWVHFYKYGSGLVPELSIGSFLASWDDQLKVYTIPFQFPQHTFDEYKLTYEIISYSLIQSNMIESIFGSNASISVKSNISDYLTPFIKNITPLSNTFYISDPNKGWNLTIEDESGFFYGIIDIVSDLDSKPYQVYINESDRIEGDTFNGVYRVLFDPSETNCITQTFKMTKFSLFDKSISKWIYSTLFSPLYSNDYHSPGITIVCPVVTDTEFPEVLEFNSTILAGTLDVGASQDHQRNVTFYLKATDPTSGLSKRHQPTVYLESISTNPFAIPCTVLDDFVSTTDYQCSGIVPYGFGMGSLIWVSLYGLIDHQLKTRGYSSSELGQMFSDYAIINREHSGKPYLKRHTPITQYGGKIIIEGYHLGSDPSLFSYILDFKNGTTLPFGSGSPDQLSNSFFSIHLPPFPTISELEITINYNDMNSNRFKIKPVSIGLVKPTFLPGNQPSPTPTPTPTPTSTPSPTPSQTPSLTPSPTPTSTTTTTPQKPIPCPDTTSSTQSFIGMNIPAYQRLVELDPDFTLLVDFNSASSNKNALCSKSSGLSSGAIAGIVVGCVAALAI